jgi:hypothetical protein
VSVVLIGDSHGANLAPPYIALAEKFGWRLWITTKASCGLSSVSQANRDGGGYTTCNTWGAANLDRILAEHPDLVVTAHRPTRAAFQEGLSQEEARAAWVDGFHDDLERLNDAGIATLVMNPKPTMNSDVPECISAHPDHLTACATPREETFGSGSRFVKPAIAGLPRADIIDMSYWVCPDAVACPAVVGNVVVFRDPHHFTETYAKTLAKPLEARLRQSDVARTTLW